MCQIRYTHKLSIHKADFSQNREVCPRVERLRLKKFIPFHTRKISRPSNQNTLCNKISFASHF